MSQYWSVSIKRKQKNPKNESKNSFDIKDCQTTIRLMRYLTNHKFVHNNPFNKNNLFYKISDRISY